MIVENVLNASNDVLNLGFRQRRAEIYTPCDQAQRAKKKSRRGMRKNKSPNPIAPSDYKKITNYRITSAKKHP
uniref:Uncharacterized protein n=1 Tax=Romanomermis culicivorax TaxID=13658 RepID=A0A915L0I4_ROMCU